MGIDLVFEGGGAKGIALVGALQALEQRDDLAPQRVMGTSAGAIMATFLAAGYGAQEMRDALTEEIAGQAIFATFLDHPRPFTSAEIEASATRDLLRRINNRLLPDVLEDRLDSFMAEALLREPLLLSPFNFIERGGLYGAAAFEQWLAAKLDDGEVNGAPRQYSGLTLHQFYEATQVHLTLIASDITAGRLLILNHFTAPACPLVAAVRMSMSFPLVWEEVVWSAAWGTYRGESMVGNRVVDGGLLSNFPIELFVSDEPQVTAVMGPRPADAQVIGFRLDEQVEVADAPPPPPPSYWSKLAQFRTIQRLMMLINTATQARDKFVVSGVRDAVVALPAKTYSTFEFDMKPERRQALIAAARAETASYLADTYPRDVLGGGVYFTEETVAEATRLATRLLDAS